MNAWQRLYGWLVSGWPRAVAPAEVVTPAPQPSSVEAPRAPLPPEPYPAPPEPPEMRAPLQVALTLADYQRAAKALGVEVAAIQAVAEVESRGAGFLPDGRPVILFEAHIFHRETGGRYATALDHRGQPLSVPRWNRSLYGATGAWQWERMGAAAALDQRAAWRACSWGIFQVMGFNHAVVGYPTIDAFVAAMRSGAGAHMDAFAGFIRANKLAPALAARDWERFAEVYNGAGHAANDYAPKMAAAYARWKARSAA